MVSGVGHGRESESSHHLGSHDASNFVLDAAFLERSGLFLRARSAFESGLDAKPHAFPGGAFEVARKIFPSSWKGEWLWDFWNVLAL